ncbi:MAG: hypothetical protein M3Y71_15610 [Actinomycetota bacterium]|nr:hypothetical protein [Actinomycetota bacterium]
MEKSTRLVRPSALTFVVLGVVAATAVQLALLAHQGGAGLFAAAPHLATQLGVSAVAAERLMNLLNSWYFTILLAALTGGWGAGLVRIAVSIATRYGKKYAIAW